MVGFKNYLKVLWLVFFFFIFRITPVNSFTEISCQEYYFTALSLEMIQDVIGDWYVKTNKYPQNLDELKDDFIKENKKYPNLIKSFLFDSWGNPYVYSLPSLRPGDDYSLYSKGKNGVDEKGEGDDILGQSSEKYQYYCPETIKVDRKYRLIKYTIISIFGAFLLFVSGGIYKLISSHLKKSNSQGHN